LNEAIVGAVAEYVTVDEPDFVVSETAVNVNASTPASTAFASVQVNVAVPSAPVVIVAGAAT